MKFYEYKGNRVHIPQGAEVSGVFRPNSGAFNIVVQEALDKIEPWERSEAPCETFTLPRRIGARAVLLDPSETPVWAVNPYHKARTPGLSPFIGLESDDERGGIDAATLELAGDVRRPILTRTYPGEYMPPLPWMKSVGDAPGGLDQCIDYWNTHAFVLRNHPIEPVVQAPEWYTPPSSPSTT